MKNRMINPQWKHSQCNDPKIELLALVQKISIILVCIKFSLSDHFVTMFIH